MKIEIRGVIQWHDKGHKKTKVVYITDRSVIRQALDLPDDIHITHGRIISGIARANNAEDRQIIVPGHIVIKNISELKK